MADFQQDPSHSDIRTWWRENIEADLLEGLGGFDGVDPDRVPQLLAILRGGKLGKACRFTAICGDQGCALVKIVDIGGRSLLICYTRQRVLSGGNYGDVRHGKRDATFHWIDGPSALVEISCRHRHEYLMALWIEQQVAEGKRRAVHPHGEVLGDGTPFRSRRLAATILRDMLEKPCEA